MKINPISQDIRHALSRLDLTNPECIHILHEIVTKESNKAYKLWHKADTLKTKDLPALEKRVKALAEIDCNLLRLNASLFL